MRAKELMHWLSMFPAEYDVRTQVVPEGDLSPYFAVVDNPETKQIWLIARHWEGDNHRCTEKERDAKGELTKGESANDGQ